jgi:hypothetical protein
MLEPVQIKMLAALVELEMPVLVEVVVEVLDLLVASPQAKLV